MRLLPGDKGKDLAMAIENMSMKQRKQRKEHLFLDFLFILFLFGVTN